MSQVTGGNLGAAEKEEWLPIETDSSDLWKIIFATFFLPISTY